MALVHSIMMGAVAGMRAMTPLATVANAARAGRLPSDNGAPAILRSPLVSAGGLAVALGELLGDKMKSAPDRIVAAGLLARIMSGALVGAALSPRRQRRLSATLGAAAAIGAAYLSFDIRVEAMQRRGQSETGLFEDAIAVGLAALIAADAARH